MDNQVGLIPAAKTLHHVHTGNVQGNGTSYDLFKVQSKLKEDYKATRNGFGYLPGVTATHPPLNEYFVDLNIVRRECREAQVTLHQLTKYSDLVTLGGEQEEKIAHILVGGDVAVGKTTLINKLALDWANLPQDNNSNDVTDGKDTETPLHKFDLVLAFDARHLQTRMDLVDAIKNQLLPGMSRPAINAMIATHGEKILYLFDGYDEWKSHKNILNNEHLNKGYVIVTTRLNKVDEFSVHYNGYTHAAILGVVWKSRKHFINKYLNPSDAQTTISKDAVDLLENVNQLYLNQVSSHPLMLTTICSLFKRKRELPLRMTTMYNHAVYDFAMHLYAKSIPIETSTEKETLEIDDLVLALGSPALKGLLLHNSKLVFDKNEIDTISRFHLAATNMWLVLSCSIVFACIGLEVGLRLESLYLSLMLALFGLVLGSILLSVKINYIFNITERGEKLGLLKRLSNNNKVTPKTVQYLFLHKTFQEFLAAKYWTSLAITNRTSFEYYLCRITKHNVAGVQYLLRFCCGLSREAAAIILQHVVTHCEVDGRFIQTLLLEAETDSSEMTSIQDILS